MAKFVTIKTMKRARAIERSGIIKARKTSFLIPTARQGHIGEYYRVNYVDAMPVSTNYVISHQWIAEIKRMYAHMPVSAIYFDLPDEQTLYYGHYAGVKKKSTAAEVASYFYQELQKDDFSHLMGFEVLIPSDIEGAIKSIKHDMKLTGWRRDGRWMARNLDTYYGAFVTSPRSIALLKNKYT
jgi:hypothetical protein